LSENVALVSSRLKYPVTSLTAPAVDVTMEYVAVGRDINSGEFIDLSLPIITSCVARWTPQYALASNLDF